MNLEDGLGQKGGGKSKDGKGRPMMPPGFPGLPGLPPLMVDPFLVDLHVKGVQKCSKGRTEGAKVPLSLLCGATAFCKKFEVQGFFDVLLQRITDRLIASDFNEIASFAIKHDIAPLRWKCMKFAEASHEIRAKFQNQQ